MQSCARTSGLVRENELVDRIRVRHRVPIAARSLRVVHRTISRRDNRVDRGALCGKERNANARAALNELPADQWEDRSLYPEYSENDNKGSWDHDDWRLGIDWDVSPNTLLYTYLATGFKSATCAVDFNAYTADDRTAGNELFRACFNSMIPAGIRQQRRHARRTLLLLPVELRFFGQRNSSD